MKPLEDLMEKIHYHFQDLNLLKTALRHRSIGPQNNERLEFLGDAILSYLIAAELYQIHPQVREGELSRMRSALVNGETLAQMGREFDLGSYLHLGVGELKSGGQQRQSILADAVEAIIGAIYLDGGIDQCRVCILNWYGDQIKDLSDLCMIKDPKSLLQEWLQARKLPLPEYEVQTTGKAHAQIFHVTCRVEGLEYSTYGKSTSRRKAEQLAAQRFLDIIL